MTTDRRRLLQTLTAAPLLSLGGCVGGRLSGGGPLSEEVRGGIDAVLSRHAIVTAGIGVIRDGDLGGEHYFGEQQPGVAAGPQTRFNVASVTKTVTAETVLRLVGQGRLDLDEPMAPWWTDPQIADDPRHALLTPRMALDHSTGLPNWRFFLPGGRLAFVADPGQTYTYSGEGMQYVARYAAAKLGRPFPDLVRETTLAPLGMDDTAIVVDRTRMETIARSRDAAGQVYEPWCRVESEGGCRPQGSWAAADDMVTTVRDYARFLRGVMDSTGYGPAVTVDRNRVQTDKGDQAVLDCAANPELTCPVRQGYGLGFNVLDYGNEIVLGHGGADWSELALVYGACAARSGLVVFLNAPNARALAAMPEVLSRVDPTCPFLPEYRRWYAESL